MSDRPCRDAAKGERGFVQLRTARSGALSYACSTSESAAQTRSLVHLQEPETELKGFILLTSGTTFRTGDFAPPEPKLNEFWTPEVGPVFSGPRNSLSRTSPPKIHLFQTPTQKSGKEIHIGHLAEKIGMTGFVRDGFGYIS